ncbi:unnamed protein product [marine sediment metagenome]|uniref:Uncharacterized protein n=1 Tax=marine sediment metagenome TaxID=412755 RepID=X1GCY8_9ZZZZ
MDKELIERVEGIINRIAKLEELFNLRFDKLKKIIGDYLDLTSNIALSSVKTSLKSV